MIHLQELNEEQIAYGEERAMAELKVKQEGHLKDCRYSYRARPGINQKPTKTKCDKS